MLMTLEKNSAGKNDNLLTSLNIYHKNSYNNRTSKLIISEDYENNTTASPSESSTIFEEIDNKNYDSSRKINYCHQRFLSNGTSSITSFDDSTCSTSSSFLNIHQIQEIPSKLKHNFVEVNNHKNNLDNSIKDDKNIKLNNIIILPSSPTNFPNARLSSTQFISLILS